jgi:hypothetical protein
MSKNNGGFAFPKSNGTFYSEDLGMTLRQYYAGQAIIGAYNGDGGLPDESYMKLIADRAFRMADAMLEAGKQ